MYTLNAEIHHEKETVRVTAMHSKCHLSGIQLYRRGFGHVGRESVKSMPGRHVEGMDLNVSAHREYVKLVYKRSGRNLLPQGGWLSLRKMAVCILKSLVPSSHRQLKNQDILSDSWWNRPDLQVYTRNIYVLSDNMAFN